MNQRLRSVEPTLRTIDEYEPAAERVREVATARMSELVQNLETQLQTHVALGEWRDWEAMQLLDLPGLQLVLDRRVEKGVYQVQTHRVTSYRHRVNVDDR